MFCSNCGNKLNENDKFCSECSQQISRNTPESKTEINNEVISASTPPINDNKNSNNSDWGGCLGCLGFLGLIVLVIILFASCSSGSSGNDSKPTYYDTGNPNDMTNKEMSNYIKWELKQDQKKWDNQQFDGK